MNSSAEIARLYVDLGSQKTKLPLGKLFVMAILAGAFIALGGLASTVASFGIQSAAAARIISGLVFPIGLSLVLVGGAELFTGNSLMIMPVLQKRAKVGGMLKNWLVVYLGNFVGSLAIAFAVAFFISGGKNGLYGGALSSSLIATANAKTSLGFGTAFVRGILCNFMVCMAVWISMAATHDLAGKIIAIYLPIFLFVLCGFEHCVANMYFIPVGFISMVQAGTSIANLPWAGFLLGNMLPVTLGNLVGGACCAGALYWYVYLQGNRE